MSTCPFCQKKKDPCAFCEKPGLPILPLRYAVARADKGEAPQLSAPFGAGVNDIALPAKDAHYTLRLLRPGYLYVFNEKRGKWYAYVVTNESYLFDFPAGKAAPDVSNVKFSCKRAGDALLARCIKVEDADTAGNLWIGFSDVVWTPAVLANHATQSYREAHMQRVNIADWLGGKHTQPHTAPITDMVKRVAEFAAMQKNPKASKSTLYDIVLKGYTKTAQYMTALQETRALDFSPHAFHDASDQVPDLLATASQACATHKPMLLGVPDAAGIAMELNSLAIHRALEWTEEPQRKWELATAAAIDGIREAVESGAVKEEAASRQQSAEMSDAYMIAKVGFPTQAAFQQHQDKVAQAGVISEAEARKIGEKAWPKYMDMYDENARTNFLKKYASDFNALEKNTIKLLDTAYLAWLKGSHFKAHFTHNFDPADADSGIAYQQTMFACIKDATGRTGVVDYFKQCLSNDPTQSGEVILRALVFNQNALAKQWNEAAAEKGAEKESAWLEMGEKIYSGFKGIIGKDHASELQGALAGLSNYIYQLSAPIMERLNDAAASGGAWLVQAALPEQRLLGLMQAWLTAQNPGKVLVDMRGMQTRKQAARALAGMLAEMTGENEQQWRSGARAALDGMANGKTQGYPYRGLFVVDKKQLAQLQGTKGAKRVAGALAATEDTEFETLLKGNVRSLTSNEVTASGLGLILTGFVLTNSYGELMKAEGAEHTTKLFSFGAGVTAALGEVGQVGGAVLEKTPWGVAKFARPISLGLARYENLAELASGAGKLLGVIGGVIAGAVQIYQGNEARKQGDVAFGVGTMFLGFATLAIAVAIWAGVFSAGIGFVIVIVLVIAGYIISLFKHDKLQHWLDSCYFGKHEMNGERFKNFSEQYAAYAAMAKGN